MRVQPIDNDRKACRSGEGGCENFSRQQAEIDVYNCGWFSRTLANPALRRFVGIWRYGNKHK